MPFLKLSIAHFGLRTPPPSPEDARSGSSHSRFLLPKCLHRTQPTRLSTLLGQDSSTADQSPQQTYLGAHNALSHSLCAPFGAVRHMTEPSPLILPASPAQSGHSADEIFNPRSLQKAPLTDEWPRAVLHEQNHDSKLSKPAKPITLLPSPVLSELQIDEMSHSSFSSHTSNDQQSWSDRLVHALPLYERHDIVTSYCDGDEAQRGPQTSAAIDEAPSTRPSLGLKQWHGTRRDIGMVCAPSSFPRYQRRPQRHRSRPCSSESNWLAGNVAERFILEKWLCDSNLSENPPHHLDDEDGGRHHIMCANVIRGAGKPKVVTIVRSKSLSTTSTSIPGDVQSPDGRNTPTRPCQEISVFSPDTPISYRQRSSTFSRPSLRPAPLNPQQDCQSSFAMLQRPLSEDGQSIKMPLKLSDPESQGTFATSFSRYAATSPMRTAPPVLASTSEAAAWSRCGKLEGIIEAVSRVMETFPDGMLCLGSPAVLALRAPYSLDDLHLDALQRIFPQTASFRLSALAALLIVDSYLSSLGDTCTSSEARPHHYFERKHGKLPARPKVCLHDIPLKARTTLGIHVPNVTYLQDHERALKERADMVAACVEFQGRSLLEAICGRYDEVVWKALKMLVQTLESNSS